MSAGKNHISITPDRFLHLPGQAEIHMYTCDRMKRVEEISCYILRT